MFLQNIMVMARGCGLDTCPQAALANYPDIVKQHLGIPDDQVVACGSSIGYQDPADTANQYRTGRAAVAEFTILHDAQHRWYGATRRSACGTRWINFRPGRTRLHQQPATLRDG